MEFFINKNSTLPILKLELIQDGRNDYKKFFEQIQNSDIFFCMTDINTGNKKIGRRPATCMLKPCENDGDCCEDQYYIAYQFREKDTNTAGTFIGEFTIVFDDGSGTLIVPIREDLIINVLDHGLKK